MATPVNNGWRLGLPLSAAVICMGMQTALGAAVLRLDPALDAVVAADAQLEMLQTNAFGIAEGPVWIRDAGPGHLLFSDIAANVIYQWTPDNQVSVFLKDSGYTGDIAQVSLQGYISRSGPVFVYTFGSDGITLDREARVVYCAQGDRAIIRLEKDGSRTVLADRYQGKRFNRPNDLVVKSDDAVYFTDVHPNTPSMELPYGGVFMVKNGSVRLLTNDFLPNGLAFSPDEKLVYINGDGGIRRYEVRADGTLENGRVFIDMSGDKAIGGPDGMKVDVNGNVFCTGPGGIWIIAPDGKHIGTILLADPATNMTFGDADYRTLYITDRRSLARIRLNVRGIAPQSR